MTNQIKIGDYITFKAATRWSYSKARRQVNGFHNSQPTVRYAGSPEFIVRTDEIIAVETAA